MLVRQGQKDRLSVVMRATRKAVGQKAVPLPQMQIKPFQSGGGHGAQFHAPACGKGPAEKLRQKILGRGAGEMIEKCLAHCQAAIS